MSSDLLDSIRTCLPQGVVIKDYLDRGGQGAVFRGWADGKPAAIKLFKPRSDPRRLERELELLESLDSPHLVRIIRHDRITYEGTALPLVSYELHEGGDLRRLLHPAAALVDFRTLATIGYHVSEAIEGLWSKRIVHRDVKPANIVIGSNGQFILVDVGLARHIDRSDITALGAAPGTPGYKSPEQAKGRKHLTIKSDWFSLGVTLYHLAAKRHPFNGQQYLVGRMTPRSLKEVRTEFPEPLCRIVHEMMAIAPTSRPRNVAARFEQLLEDDTCSC